MNYLEQANLIKDEICAVRHSIHSEPELGRSEFKTAEKIERELNSLGIETLRMLDTAVVGTLHGAFPGRTVAFRADMDALPITEKTGCEFASRNQGRMHACGHDVHTSVLIGAAKLLAANREKLHGTVKFFFQPDEEGRGGAERMIELGCLEGVDAVFGMHVAPDLPAGTIGVKYGKFYAASNTFHVTVHGRSAHAATPEKAIDSLQTAADMLMGIRRLRERMRKKYGPLVISVARLHAGTACNIIPDTAELEGIIRTLGPEARADVIESFKSLVNRTAEEWGAKADILIHESYPGVVNDDASTAFVEEQARRLFGDEKVTVIPEPTMTTEDFGYFLMQRPGTFFHLGVGGEYPLHNPCFLPDDSVLPPASAFEAQLITEFLNSKDI